MIITNKLFTNQVVFTFAVIIIGGIFMVNNSASADIGVVAPTGVIVAPGDNTSIKNGTVLAVQTDGNNGSGVDKVLFYYYDTVANQIGNEIISGENGVYSINWNSGSLVDGQYMVFAAVYDKAGNFFITAPITVSLDSLPPAIFSAEAIDPQTVKVTFNEALRSINNSSSNFVVYQNSGEDAVAISSLSFSADILTLNLATPLKTADDPTYIISAGAIADLAGNKTVTDLSGVIKKKTSPFISLKGGSVVYINAGGTYNDAGAVCVDFANDNPLVSMIGGVNTKTAGIYVLLYNCSDAAGNQAVQAQRTIVVKALSDSLGNSSYSSSACQNVTYGEWGSCFNGLQYRNVLSTDPRYCALAAEQQSVRSRQCSGQVLGVQIYASGSLIRTPDKKIFLVLNNNQVQKIKDLKELAKYKNRKIYQVSYELFAQFKQVLGIKIYANGTLLRGPDKKIYVISSGKKYYISSLNELAKYKNSPIYNVGAEVISGY
jgi:hypothetical protein